MGVRENKVEKYLDKQITALGGLTRKWTSPGRDGVPDRICIVQGRFFLVEVKTVDGKCSPTQLREHTRLSDAGADVRVVYGEQGVDVFIRDIRNSLGLKWTCYQCDKPVAYLFDDSRGECCTRLTPEEIRGDIV
jgi:hypothetical protein